MRLHTHNLCTDSQTVVTASSSNPSFPASNLKHQFRSKRWRATGDVSEWVKFDFLTSESVNSAVILWPKEDGIRLTDSAVVKLQANATDVWTSPAIDQVLTINNDYSIASHYFETPQNYRYWRVVVLDPTNPYGYVELGVVWIGNSLAIDNCENGFKFGSEDQTNITVTDFGHRYADEYPQMRTLQISYDLLDYSAIEIIDQALLDVGTRKPVLIVLDPFEEVFSKDHFTIYGCFTKGISLSHKIYDVLNVDTLTVVELS